MRRDKLHHMLVGGAIAIAKNGIKMTGMPAWRDSLPDAQIWDVVGFIEAMRQMPPQTYKELRARRMCGGFNGPWPAR